MAWPLSERTAKTAFLLSEGAGDQLRQRSCAQGVAGFEPEGPASPAGCTDRTPSGAKTGGARLCESQQSNQFTQPNQPIPSQIEGQARFRWEKKVLAFDHCAGAVRVPVRVATNVSAYDGKVAAADPQMAVNTDPQRNPNTECDSHAAFLPYANTHSGYANPTGLATPTFSLPPTYSPTPLPYVFKPGDPTATPLGSDINDPNFIAGVASYNAKDYTETIRLMSKVIASDPNLAPPYHYRGKSYWNLRDCVPGLADEDKALALDPDYAAAWAEHGVLNSCLGNLAEAMDDYQKALSLDPSLSLVHNNLGVDYYTQGDYLSSLDEYKLSVAIDPGRAGAWDGMSEAQGKLGQFSECVQSATTAIGLQPNLWLAYADRGYCLNFLERYEEASIDYKLYLVQNPNDSLALDNLGIAQWHIGALQDALASYNKAISLDPSNFRAHINRGLVYHDLQQYYQAINDYNIALQYGDIVAAYKDRGLAYNDLQKYSPAILDFEKVLSLDPNHPGTYCELARSYLGVGRYQDALDAAEKSNQNDSGCDGRILLEVQARSYYALENYDQGLVYINKAIALEPYAIDYYYRGIIFQAAGRNVEAITDLDWFVKYEQANGIQGPEITDAKLRLKKLNP